MLACSGVSLAAATVSGLFGARQHNMPLLLICMGVAVTAFLVHLIIVCLKPE
jgi:hypothetical protein